MSSWYPIDGFSGPGEYDRFCAYLRGQQEAGVARQVPVDMGYGPGEVYGGTWYLNVETGETWRLVPPDFPFRGLWERVVAVGPADSREK